MAGIGPQLPPHLRTKECEEKKDCGTYGPALPPGFASENETSVTVGPCLPEHLLLKDDSEEDTSEDEIVGPGLPGQDTSEGYNQIKEEFEARADAMKNKLTGKGTGDEKLQRETWMLELPPELTKNFGLGPRTFRAKAPELGDRSVWTDTPADKEKRKQERREEAQSCKKKKKPEEKQPTAEELEMHAQVEEYNKKTRPQSLMEMHQEKRKNTVEAPSSVRRPFDRDRDLSLHRSDPKEKAKFIQQANGLNKKFSKGTFENKFL